MKRYKIGDIVDFKGWIDNDTFNWLGGKIVEVEKNCNFPKNNGTYGWKKATGYTVEVQFDEVQNWAPDDNCDMGQRYLLEYRDLEEHVPSRFHPGIEDDDVDIKCYEWIPCSDENYWTDVEGYASIVKLNGSIYTQYTCPYGWNVLIDMGAELLNIEI